MCCVGNSVMALLAYPRKHHPANTLQSLNSGLQVTLTKEVGLGHDITLTTEAGAKAASEQYGHEPNPYLQDHGLKGSATGQMVKLADLKALEAEEVACTIGSTKAGQWDTRWDCA